MNLEKVVIIIPTYNEAAGIVKTIQEVFSNTKENADFDIHVLIFDSASTDATLAQVKGLQPQYPNLCLQSEARKTGLGSAYLKAMIHALNQLQADIIIEFDADLSHQPKYLNSMLEIIKTCDVVIGSRYVKGGTIPLDWGWHRKVMSIMGNYLARCFLTPKYRDFTTGFRATRRAHLVRALPSKFISNGYAYKLELLWRLHKNKARIIEYPIHFIDRKEGYSKLPANSIKESLKVLCILRFSKYKTYIRMCLVGVVGGCVQLLIYNAARHFINPFHASQISVLAAIINNYVLNNWLTFKKHLSWSLADNIKSIVTFFAHTLFMVFAQSYWLSFMINRIGGGFYKENLVLLMGLIMGSIINYLVYSRLVWPQHKIRPNV